VQSRTWGNYFIATANCCKVEVHQLKPLQQHSKGSLSSMRESEVIFHLYQQAFQEISKLPRIFMTVAVTTAQAEWSSSKLCVVKPYLRNRMSSQRISNLAILAIEQDIGLIVWI